jgi:hypothetical protein
MQTKEMFKKSEISMHDLIPISLETSTYILNDFLE